MFRGIHQLFEEQAEKTPDAEALIFEGKTMTYGELESSSNQVAHFLRSQGIGSEILVGISISKSFEMIIAVLGILKTGAAYVPIDQETPQDLVDHILDDSKAEFVISEKNQSQRFNSYKKQLFLYEECLNAINSQSTERLTNTVLPENLYYIIYTSGSTGRPKGVIVEHKTIYNVLQSIKEETGITDKDTLIALANLSFDVSTVEIFSPLMVGGRVKIVSSATIKNAQELRREIENGVTIFHAGPFQYKMLIEAGWIGNKSLKLISTGEALPLNTAKMLLDRCGELWNMYGPSETMHVTSYQVKKEDPLITIGYPIKNTSIYILDENRQQVKAGVKGEIYIGGYGVTRGYLNQPNLTAEKFLPDPFSNDPKAQMYRSGDIGRLLDNGQIEYLGREDYQIKIRGHRIESLCKNDFFLHSN